MVYKKELFIVFLVGAVTYSLIEIFWRGFTHWSMTITGGLCFMIFYKINVLNEFTIIQKCILSMLIITSFEFVVGGFVNLAWGLNVWDYSSQVFDLEGQICPLFSIIWFFMGIPMSAATFFIRNRIVEYSS